MAQSDVQLLTFWPSPYGMRVAIALHLKEVDYETVEQNLMNKSELLLQSNPIYKQIPVLIHNGNPICQSMVALEYIDEAWPQGPSILPKDPLERANARFWADFIDKEYIQVFTGSMRSGGEEKEKAMKKLAENTVILEEALKKVEEKPFFGGKDVGLPDIVLAPLAAWMPALAALGSPDVPPPEVCPTLYQWMAAITEVPYVKAVLPDLEKLKAFVIKMREMKAASSSS